MPGGEEKSIGDQKKKKGEVKVNGANSEKIELMTELVSLGGFIAQIAAKSLETLVGPAETRKILLESRRCRGAESDKTMVEDDQ